MEPDAVSPPVVTLHLWGVQGVGVLKAVMRMATQRRAVRKSRGVQFAKLLGTGSGDTFQIRDADPHHWGLLIAWRSLADARIFEHGPIVTAWDRTSYERLLVVMTPISSRGSWARKDPFSPTGFPEGGPVAAITRARIKPNHWARFGTFVPPVAEALEAADGLVLRTGIGEAPIGLQGTFSLWRDEHALRSFTYGEQHRTVIDETHRSGWYSEELFARLNVTRASGGFCGTQIDIA